MLDDISLVHLDSYGCHNIAQKYTNQFNIQFILNQLSMPLSQLFKKAWNIAKALTKW